MPPSSPSSISSSECPSVTSLLLWYLFLCHLIALSLSPWPCLSLSLSLCQPLSFSAQPGAQHTQYKGWFLSPIWPWQLIFEFAERLQKHSAHHRGPVGMYAVYGVINFCFPGQKQPLLYYTHLNVILSGLAEMRIAYFSENLSLNVRVFSQPVWIFERPFSWAAVLSRSVFLFQSIVRPLFSWQAAESEPAALLLRALQQNGGEKCNSGFPGSTCAPQRNYLKHILSG